MDMIAPHDEHDAEFFDSHDFAAPGEWKIANCNVGLSRCCCYQACETSGRSSPRSVVGNSKFVHQLTGDSRQLAFNFVLGASRAKNKARAADRVDQRYLARAVDLLPQVADVHIDKIGCRNELVAPHFVQQHAARQ
jgi:hypothetical protein